jgi:hypothetical protein
MVFQEPGRPGGLLGQLGELLHRCPEAAVPGGAEWSRLRFQELAGMGDRSRPKEVVITEMSHVDQD